MRVGRIKSGLADILNMDLAFTKISTKGSQTEMEIVDKQTGTREPKVFIIPDRDLEYTIVLNNSLSYAPTIVKKLVLVKEFSHFLYISQLRDALVRDISARWEFPEVGQNNLADFLFINAVVHESTDHIPTLPDFYNNFNHYVDGAGYWHIMRAYGRMKARKMLSANDISSILRVDDVFNRALAKGILKDTGKGNYERKDGIGPMSPEWTSIIVPSLKQAK